MWFWTLFCWYWWTKISCRCQLGKVVQWNQEERIIFQLSIFRASRSDFMVRVGLSFSWKPKKVAKIVKAKVLDFFTHSSNGDMRLRHFVKIWHLSPMKLYLHILKTAATITSWNALKFLPRREIASPVSIPPLSGTLTLGWWAVHMEDRWVCECIPMKSTSFKTLNGLAWRFLSKCSSL